MTDDLPARLGHLRWNDDQTWLYLVLGEQEYPIADLETYDDGGAMAYIHSWHERTESLKVPCRSAEEARAVIKALLGIRMVVEVTDE